MNSCLVTGGAGFIGRHLIKMLSANGVKVFSVDIAEMPKDAGCSHIVCDVAKREEFIAVLDKTDPTWIVHLAAIHDLSNPENERNGLSSYRSNIESTENILLWLKSRGAGKTFIYASSQLVNRIGTINYSVDRCVPDTYYGESKVLCEKMIRDADISEVTWCIIRPTTIWGPGMSAHYRRFLDYLNRGRYRHPGDEPLFKSYGFVANTVYQIFKLLSADASKINRKVFYLADYEPISLKKYAQELSKAIGAPPVRSLPLPFFWMLACTGTLITRLGWKTFPMTLKRLHNIRTEYIVDTGELKDLVGPLPWNFMQGIEATGEWYKRLCLRSITTK